MPKKIYVSVGIDVDAFGGWLGSYGGEDSPGDISRGLFAGEVGVPRLLQLAQRREMPVTWFWPGHSVETFPEQFDAVVAAGHEIGVHGYSHENPIAMSRARRKPRSLTTAPTSSSGVPGASRWGTWRRGGSSPR